ncbi:DUF4920 domain-containing protein [Winogradskyella endarachnes]|uniref:DUF4920 domain-containing protein n=1 Tax=Winogradskyella endarachnes TaxID=2681965 RepID=A0A6L6U762_9FLAO|nr:DUF4920 domain-containing protein [Winogradskyella endarachnes]MUU78091.1 DUF4920 domain-containing protein [Winogradskyella endarachnes]
MKKTILLIAISIATFSCKNESKTAEDKTIEVETVDTKKDIAYASFGKEITDADALSGEKMIENFKNLKVGDTINAKMKGEIIEVCSKKGCWMTLDTGEDEVMVKFKDYGFFMPLNAEGNVVINGKAFVSETSVDELRHYAEDAGKSEEEIAAITTPKFEYRFEADGVLLQQ